MLLRGPPHQGGTQERTGLQIERTRGLGRREALRLGRPERGCGSAARSIRGTGAACTAPRPAPAPQERRGRWCAAPRAAAGPRSERVPRPQHRRSREAQGQRHVVDGVAGLEPDRGTRAAPGRRRAGRSLARVRRGSQRRRRRVLAGSEALRQRRRRGRSRRCGAAGGRRRTLRGCARRPASARSEWPPSAKKSSCGPDGSRRRSSAKIPAEDLLGRRAGRPSRRRHGLVRLRARQRAAVDLPVGRQRQAPAGARRPAGIMGSGRRSRRKSRSVSGADRSGLAGTT